MINEMVASDGVHSADTKDMPWWSGKGKVREYIKKVNENKKVSRSVLI
jgi:hypothetical protein